MIRKWILGLAVALLAVGGVVGVVIWQQSRDDGDNVVVERPKFRLSEEYYGQGELKEISAEKFSELITERQSFVVVAKMTICPAEFPITDVAKRLAHEQGVTILALTETQFRETELAEKIKYLPSAAIYHDGELVDFLDAESDEDLKFYQNVEGLSEWLSENGVEL